jgi:phosphoribosylamine--glycine ligase
LAVANEKLDEITLEIDERSATTVMVVSGGYLKSMKRKSDFWTRKITDSIVFHAGTKLQNRTVVSNGGRVLAITSYGNDFQEAIKNLIKI